NSIIDVDNAILRYMDYGFYNNTYYSPTSFSVTNSTITEFNNYALYTDHYYESASTTYTLTNVTITDGNGGSTGQSYAAIYLRARNLGNINLAFDGITIDDYGNNTGDHGLTIEVQDNAGAVVTGRVDNMTLTDLDISGGNTVAGDGIYLYDQTDATGQTNITFSGLDFSGTGRYGVYLRGNALNTLASVDNTSTNVNTITGSATSAYNLLLDGIKGGDYDYITLSTATASSLYFTNDAAPTNWAL
ncbi:MAG: hypothetical protein GY942_04420, partial [Aestuariibacter sp.]|nr:hypothetical protein [Aestuariibacter sp.]